MEFFALISKLFLAKHTFRSFSVNRAPFHNQVNNVINLFIAIYSARGFWDCLAGIQLIRKLKRFVLFTLHYYQKYLIQLSNLT